MNKMKLSSIVGLVFALAQIAVAQTTTFTYQGRLTDNNAAATGAYQMQFALFDAVTAGMQTDATLTFDGNGTNPAAVSVAGGVFTVQLNFGSSPFAAGANRFLEIAVKRPADASYTTLTPRQQLTASPYSIRTISAGAADSLSGNCVSCVTNAQINSIDGAKVTGTVGDGQLSANVALRNTANTFTGTLSASNLSGTNTGDVTLGAVGATPNSNGGSLSGQALTLQPANGANPGVLTAGTQTIGGSKTFSGNVRNNGMFRGGNETGTSETPAIGGETYNGLVTRRVNSIISTAGRVIARTDTITFERTGSDGGFRVSYTAGGSRTVHCLGVSSTGAVIGSRIVIPQSAGTSQVYTDAQDIEYLQCSFGSTFNNNSHVTQITLERFRGDSFWVGTVTSTVNQ